MLTLLFLITASRGVAIFQVNRSSNVMALLSQLIRRGTVPLLRLGVRCQEPGARVTCYSRAVRTLRPYTTAVLFLAVTVSATHVSAQDFTDELWEANRDIYDAILEHPFLTGLQDGTLPRDAFIFYLVQDMHYLEAFARALRVTAAKAPRHEWRELLNTHAAAALSNELTLHNRLFEEHGVPQSIQEGMELAPEAFRLHQFSNCNRTHRNVCRSNRCPAPLLLDLLGGCERVKDTGIR